MTRITVACLDMAGTTIADDGTVLEAFSAAITAQNLPAATYDQAMTDVRSSMGQSKIEVFRRILGDEETAQKANDAFEDHYAAAVRGGAVAAVPGAEETITALRQAGVRVCLATGFSPATRDAIIDKLVWGGLIDLALSPADAGFWGFEGRGRPWPDLPLIALLKLRGGAVSELAVVGDTASDIESGLRAGAAIVAGVLTGASSRADLERAGAPLILDTIADILPYVTGLPAGGGDEHRLGRQRHRDRRARGQRGGFGAGLVDLDGDVAGQQDADPGHRAEEGPGGHDPVAVLHDLHRQPFRPHEHVHRPIAAGGTLAGLGRLLVLDRHGAAEHGYRPGSAACSSPGIRFMTPTNSATNAVAGSSYSSSGAAICSSLPCRMTPTRSAIDSASSWSWVTNRVVVPSRCCSVRICSRSCSRTLASSADSGSSSSSTRGSMASARASATRCC